MKYVEYCGSVWEVFEDLGDKVHISLTSDGTEVTVRKALVRPLDESEISDSAEDLIAKLSDQ